MTIHHFVHVEGLGALTDLVQKIYEELNVMNTRTTCPVEVIDGKDPEVQEKLGIKPETPAWWQNLADAPKNTASRRRWTPQEDNIVIAGYSKGWNPAAISEILKRQGFDRTAHAIVNHMSDLRRNTK